MRDYRDAKAMAQSLRQALTHDNLAVTHSRSLELVAQAFGLDNWNILAARIEADRPAAVEVGPKTLHCSFCGKSQHDVRKLIAGPNALICDECVALCNDVIEHTDVLALLPADEARDGDDSALNAYLAGRASEQLRAYLAKAEQAIARDRESIRVAAAAIEARAGRRSVGAEPFGPTLKFLADKSDAELEAHKAALERSLARSLRVPPIVARILAERDSLKPL
jgi:hypothetical protein